MHPFPLYSAASKQWQKIGAYPHHGINIALFSLHSKHSLGIGDFSDLIPVIDWAAAIGLDIIQLLPLNDTGHDSSPYNALSAFALNSLHISLHSLPFLEDYPELITTLEAIPSIPRSSRVEYERVREIKESFLNLYYTKTKEKIFQSSDYESFIECSASWLKGYALYKALRLMYEGQPWTSWPEHLQNPDSERLEELYIEYAKEIEWHSFIQFICDQQLHAVKQHATSKGVHLMGDIPILISPESAEAWLHSRLFYFDRTAGSPPDFYSTEGQSWGFPIYNWDQIEKENYRWWIDRLQCASRYYSLYRLDHVVGFFRIWAIAAGQSSKQGLFEPADSSKWISQGKKIMNRMLEQCEMLPIGEDLGVVPPEVRSCLTQLGICGTKVMRWERRWDGDGRFIPIQNYPELSLTTVSTHDSEPLQLWWKNYPEEAEYYAHFKGWTYSPNLTYDQHYSILWDSHHTASLFHVNLLQEYFAMLPDLTWPDPEDERINVPGIIADTNWTYRMRPSIEEFTTNETLKTFLLNLIH